MFQSANNKKSRIIEGEIMNDNKEIQKSSNKVIDLICGYITKNADETKDYNHFVKNMENDERFQEIIKEMIEHI